MNEKWDPKRRLCSDHGSPAMATRQGMVWLNYCPICKIETLESERDDARREICREKSYLSSRGYARQRNWGYLYDELKGDPNESRQRTEKL